MGGKRSRKKKTKTKAQKMAVANKKKYGGTASAAAANRAASRAAAKKRYQASQAAKQAAKKSTPKSISKGTTGIGPVKSGSTYAKAVSTAKNQPTKKTSGIGPYASAAKYEAALKASPPKFTPKFTEATKVASSMSAGSYGGYVDAGESRGFVSPEQADRMLKNPEAYKMRPSETRYLRESMGLPLASAGNLTGLGIGDAKAATGFTPSVPGLAESLGIDSKTGLDSEGRGPSYLSTKSPDSFGAPSQAAVDAAAGITAGGLNIGGGGGGSTPDKGSTTSRAISDRPASSFSFGPSADGNEYAKNLSEFGMRFGATPEARGQAYDQNPDLTSFKGLSDGTTFGSGPVASGDAYARGLNIAPFGSVENTMRSIVGRIPLVNRIPGVNTRLLTDKEIADKRVKASDFRKANLVGRNRGGGGARLPVAPLTPEEILLPEEMTAQTAPVYQQIAGQTGVDPNRLMQIQQDAYLQAFNPSYNPMFRFFNRGMRRGAFRKAFRRD